MGAAAKSYIVIVEVRFRHPSKSIPHSPFTKSDLESRPPIGPFEHRGLLGRSRTVLRSLRHHSHAAQIEAVGIPANLNRKVGVNQPLCDPSQNGCDLDWPQAHRQCSPVSSFTLNGLRPATLGSAISKFSLSKVVQGSLPIKGRTPSMWKWTKCLHSSSVSGSLF